MAATNGYKRRQGLTVEQQNAIDRLVVGDTDLETADAVGVNRVTVSKWRLYDPTFQAALNARRQEVWGASAEKLRSLVPKAIDTLTAAMESGNVPAAVTVLKAAALDKLAPPAGPTDPDELFAALVEARVKEKHAKRQRTRGTEEMFEEMTAGYLARLEAEYTAAARDEITAEIETRLNGDGQQAEPLAR